MIFRKCRYRFSNRLIMKNSHLPTRIIGILMPLLLLLFSIAVINSYDNNSIRQHFNDCHVITRRKLIFLFIDLLQPTRNVNWYRPAIIHKSWLHAAVIILKHPRQESILFASILVNSKYTVSSFFRKFFFFFYGDFTWKSVNYTII